MHLSRRWAQQWVTASAVAEYLGVSLSTVRKWIRDGSLKATMVQQRHYSDERPRKTKRGEYRVQKRDVDSFLAAFRSGRV